MKEKELFFLKKSLFEERLVERLDPGNVKEISEGELSPFCDYYGALVGIEKFLENKEDYQKLYLDDYPRNYSAALSYLLRNIFVPNYKTLKGRLNDRIRGLLQEERILAGARTLEELIERLSISREKIVKLHKLGFSFSEKEKLEREFEDYLRQVLDYAGLLQEYLFVLRPQIVGSLSNPSALMRTQNQAIDLLSLLGKQGNNYRIGRDKLLEELSISKLEIKGEPIKERLFFYKGEEHYSTKAFVKEWEMVISQIKQLEEIREGKAVRRRFRAPAITSLKKAMAVGLAGLISLGGVLYAFPSWRYTLGLPVSKMEKMEIFHERGKYKSSWRVLQQLKESDRIDEDVASYWEGKIQLARAGKTMRDGKTSVEEAYKIAGEIMKGSIPKLIEGGKPEIDEKEIIKTFFDAGYIKRRENLAFREDYASPQLAAQSHLCNLFNRPKEAMEPEEAGLFDAIQDSDVLYVGQTQTQAFFLSDKGDKIEYLLQKEGNKYKVTNIKIERE